MTISLSNVRSGRIDTPRRVVIYGVEGVGKSTFAANAPSPIFLCAEDGTCHLDVHRLAPTSWDDVLEALRCLRMEKHDYKTLVIDSLDWVEPLVWRHICQRDNKKDIEDYGWSKGYTVAMDEWRLFVHVLESIQYKSNMHIVCIAHCGVRSFKNPMGEDYDRYEMSLHRSASAFFRQWAEDVLFARYEEYGYKVGKATRARGVDTGRRVLMTQHSAAYDAKTHHALPAELDLSWSAYVEAVAKNFRESPKAVRERCLKKALMLGEKSEAAARSILQAGDDVSRLLTLEARCDELISMAAREAAQKEETK